ncbi:MAG: hypothetical protein ABSA85_00165 [Terracidiphilus sp.]|jgi:hypothetical protein
MRLPTLSQKSRNDGARAALTALNLWYITTLVVHNRRLTHVPPSPSGSYTFLETAELEER